MKQVHYNILKNEQVGKNVYQMVLSSDEEISYLPGQFVNLKLDQFYLRRPLSVSSYDSHQLVLLYKVLGQGTKELTGYLPGQTLDILCPLGNGFDIKNCQKPLLIAGGIGIAPMIGLAQYFSQQGIQPTILYGASTEADLVLLKELKALGNVIVATDDGSIGYHGNIVDYLKNHQVPFDQYYACGPLPMLKNLKEWSTQGYLSLEARMGCGFGACMGCSIETVNGPKRICKEGPVFQASEVILP